MLLYNLDVDVLLLELEFRMIYWIGAMRDAPNQADLTCTHHECPYQECADRHLVP